LYFVQKNNFLRLEIIVVLEGNFMLPDCIHWRWVFEHWAGSWWFRNTNECWVIRCYFGAVSSGQLRKFALTNRHLNIMELLCDILLSIDQIILKIAAK